jgi:hypothetical protein
MNIKRLKKLIRDFEQAAFDAGVDAGRGMTRQLDVDLRYMRARRADLLDAILAEATRDAAKVLTESSSR